MIPRFTDRFFAYKSYAECITRKILKNNSININTSSLPTMPTT